jgi:hypothetical protein
VYARNLSHCRGSDYWYRPHYSTEDITLWSQSSSLQYLRIQTVPQREHIHRYKDQLSEAVYGVNHTKPINTKEALLIVKSLKG